MHLEITLNADPLFADDAAGGAFAAGGGAAPPSLLSPPASWPSSASSPLRYVTVLRHPLSRALSHYRMGTANVTMPAIGWNGSPFGERAVTLRMFAEVWRSVEGTHSPRTDSEHRDRTP